MPVKPPPPRHTTEYIGDKLIVIIPSQRYWFVELLYWFSLVMWVLVDIFFIYILIISIKSDEPPAFFLITMLVGIVVFTALAAARAYVLVWHAYGKEMIEITNQSITINRFVLGPGSPKEYLADSIKDLRLVPSNTVLDHPMLAWIYSFRFPILYETMRWLAFDYGAKTIRLGSGIDEAEAKQIIAEIQQRYPRYRSSDFSRSNG